MAEPAARTPSVRVGAVIVTYRPDTGALYDLLAAVAPQVADIVVIDNGSDAAIVAAMRREAQRFGGTLLALGVNRGIAAAHNRGCEQLIASGATHVLLLDQDSVPAPDMVERLLVALFAGPLEGSTRPLAAVGAIARDDRDGEPPFVYAARRWGPRRADLPVADGARVEAGFLIASGCLIDVRALESVGPMAEELFIDHVDLEWGVRARNAGWTLAAVVGAELRHHLGDEPQYVPGRSRSVHVQSVARNYYMVRNTVWLVRSPTLPTAWRWGYLWWITKYLAFYVVAVPPRRQRVPLMLRGLFDGLRGRTGPMPAGR